MADELKAVQRSNCEDWCEQAVGDICPHGGPEITIKACHAVSMVALLTWFREMIPLVKFPTTMERSDDLTQAYCDELIEDLTP